MSRVNIQGPDIVCSMGTDHMSEQEKILAGLHRGSPTQVDGTEPTPSKIPQVTTRVYKEGIMLGSFLWSGRLEEMPLKKDKAGIPLVLQKGYELEYDFSERVLAATTGEAVFKEIREILEEYLLLPHKNLYTLLSLWIMHTYVFELFPNTPYILLNSPKPGCGKTITLEILNGLSHHGSGVVGKVSEAGLRRAIKEKCTLVQDEAERLSPEYKQASDDIITAINHGYSKGAVSLLTEMDQGKATDKVKRWDVYCPKAFASLGTVIDTIVSRSFRILLQQKQPSDGLAEFISEENTTQFEALKAKQAQWAKVFKAQGSHLKHMPNKEKGWELFPGCSDARLGRMGLPLVAIAKSMIEETQYREAYDKLVEALRTFSNRRSNEDKLHDVYVYAEAYRSLLCGREKAVISNEDVQSVIKGIDKSVVFNKEVVKGFGLEEMRPRTPSGRVRSFEVTREWVDRILEGESPTHAKQEKPTNA